MAAFNHLSRDLRTRIDTMRNEVGITRSIIKKRDQVCSELKKTDLKDDALWNALQKKASLTTAQRDVFRKTQSEYGRFRKEVLELLTDSQRNRLPQNKNKS